MPSKSWLCTRNTSKQIFIVYTITITLLAICQISTIAAEANAHRTATATAAATATATVKAAEAAAPATNIHQNILADDIENEEFIDGSSNQPHSRRKRLIWITDDGRLALPPGTTLTFTPTIALPLVRHPPEGFFSNVSISFPVTIDFDKLGLTDNQNPLGDLPPIFARSFGHVAGRMLGNYMSQYLHYKRKREIHDQPSKEEQQKFTTSSRYNSRFNVKHDPVPSETQDNNEFPQLPERFKHIFHGGERIMLYGVVEDFLSTFGMNGKACLLRTICEVHSRNLEHFGVFGEMFKLFLTVTRSPFADLIPEYVQAQDIGEGREAPGECFPYYKECPKSIFKAIENHKYREQKQPLGEYHEEEVEEISHHTLPTRFTAEQNDGDRTMTSKDENYEEEKKQNEIDGISRASGKSSTKLFTM